MEISYKCSETDYLRVDFNREPIEQINKDTGILLDYLNTVDLSEENKSEKINEIEETIANLLKEKVDTTIVTNNNVLLALTKYNFHLLDDIDSNEQFYENVFDPYLKLLKQLSKSNDEDNFICAQNSQFHEFLTKLLLSSQETHVLKKTIKIIKNFVFKKPKTSDLFDHDLLIQNLYNNYTKYFFLNKTSDFIGEPDSNKVIDKVIIPSLKLANILIINNQYVIDNLDKHVYRFVVAVENILANNRSNENQENYYIQLNTILHQLHFILVNARKKIIEQFLTFTIVHQLIKNINIGNQTTINILKCLRVYSLYFSGAYLILLKEDFCCFRPIQSNFEKNEYYTKVIKIYCQVWTNVIFSILNSTVSHHGRIQSAKINIQNNARNLFEYLNEIYENYDDFEYQKSLLFLIITFANYNEYNTLNHLITQFPNIVEKIFYILDERNPNDLLVITNALINIIEIYSKNGFVNEQIGKEIAIYKNEITKGIDETRKMIENPKFSHINTIDDNINQIYEMLDKIVPDDD